MNFKLPFILLVIGVGVAGATPFGIAQLGFEPEPSMEIDMIAGQTQNPFRIQDSNDVDVFCISPNGTIECGGSNYREMDFNQEEVISFSNVYADLPTGEFDYAHDSVLAVWTIDTGDRIEWRTGIFNGFIQVNMRTTAGASFCQMDWEGWNAQSLVWESIQGQFGAGGSGASWSLFSDTYPQNYDENVNQFRIIVYSGDAPTVCEFRNMDSIFVTYMPDGHTMVRSK